MKQQNSDDQESFFGSLIYAYSRAEALVDGALVDVSEMAREAGFRLPVAMTAAVWADCVEWTDVDSVRQAMQDEAGRLWDALWMAGLAARRADREHRIVFKLNRVPRGEKSSRAQLTTLHLHIGPGDDGKPVITILMPNED